jgi:hypothetical protein
LTVLTRELVNERAFAGTRSSGQTNDKRLSGVREERFQKIDGFGGMVLDCADGTRQRSRIARAYALDEGSRLRHENLQVYNDCNFLQISISLTEHAVPLVTQSAAVRRIRWRRLAACLAMICLAVHLAARFRAPVSVSTTVQINSAKAKVQHLENDAVRWFPPLASALFSLSSSPAPRVTAEDPPQVTRPLDERLCNRPPPRA